jgi:putative chitinase
MTRVTADDLRRLAPKGDSAMLTRLAPSLSVTLARYGITTPRRFAHFIAQAAHETAGFQTLVEYGDDPYFNKRYGPQTSVGKRLGNTQPGDGARFRGRGIFQCTGRFNYSKYGKAIGIDLVGQPARAADPVNSIQIACEYWKAKGLNALADADDIEGITRKINGGLNGLADRKAYLAKAKAIVGGWHGSGSGPASDAGSRSA